VVVRVLNYNKHVLFLCFRAVIESRHRASSGLAKCFVCNLTAVLVRVGVRVLNYNKHVLFLCFRAVIESRHRASSGLAKCFACNLIAVWVRRNDMAPYDSVPRIAVQRTMKSLDKSKAGGVMRNDF
jgi:hypothetical protein